MDPRRHRPDRYEARRNDGGFSFDRFYRQNRRVLIWIILGFLLWLLRSFFSLIFLTFVFAFLASPIADFFVRRLNVRRPIAICLTFGIFLFSMTAVSVFVVPQVAREAVSLVRNLPKTEQRLFDLRKNFIERHPNVEPILMNYLRSTIPDESLEELAVVEAAANGSPLSPAAPQGTDTGSIDPSVETADTPPVDPAELELRRAARQDEAVIHLFIGHQIQKITDAMPGLIRMMWSASATVLLALLFSFLISLDLSRLGQEVRNLRASRLRDFHKEVAQPVVRFAYVVGRAIQAQAMIAMVNTVLTLVGLMILGVPSLAVLSMIVFLCSFIPVLGVFLSTTPIVLVALNAGGLNLALLCVGMVIVVHAVEAYLLNPMIYGKHLKLNPVLVLIILFIGHHAFGAWGMLLGVPVAHYFLHDVFGVPIWSDRRLARKGSYVKPLPPEPTEIDPDPLPPAPERPPARPRAS
ncbi:MAG: AI-2E family transporter [Verrucomicrobiales bacterium]